MRVLFADDEADFLAPLVKRLGKRGIEARTAASGEEAVKVLEAEDFDVVVLDVKMPGMGGMAALREVRVLRPETPVIMLTAHADLEDAVLGLESGAFAHLMKPVNLDELVYRLEDAHKHKQLLMQRTRNRTRPAANT